MRLLRLRFALATAAVCLAAGSPVWAAGDGTVVNTLDHCCPPYIKHCFEGPPKIKFKAGCPKPICDPCSLDHFGYYQTCWAPWPFPPDWSHCRVPPTSATVPPHPGRAPVIAEPRNSLPNLEEAPAPRSVIDMSMAKPYSSR